MKRGVPVDRIISIAVFIALEVFCVILIYNNSSLQHSRIAEAIRSANAFIEEKNSTLREYANLRQENGKLAEENAALRGRLAIMDGLVEERPEADSSLMECRGRFSYMAAKVINNTINRQHNFLILDKGSEDGVREGMGIVTSKGVIGIISVCDKHYCKAKSLLDTDLKISGKLLKDNNLGLVSWGGVSTGKTNMTELPTHSDINPGDTVVTSGYSAIFPQGIPIGVVRECRSDGVSISAELALFENFHSLQYAYIVSDSDMTVLKNLEEKE